MRQPRSTTFFHAFPTALMCVAGGSFMQAAPLMFERDIRPILKAHCFHCHGEEKEIKGGLDVRLKHFMENGGDSGPAILAGEAHKSLLIEQLESGDMPKGGKKLPDAEIAKIEQWIAEGAKTLRAEPATLAPGTVISEEERAYWAFQPIQRPKVPAVVIGHQSSVIGGNPIDAFLQVGLGSTLVYWGGEMGRLPVIQGRGKGKPGRDHNTDGFSIWMACGGVKRGHVHGSTDEFGLFAQDDVVYHHDYLATVLHLMGLNADKLAYKRGARNETILNGQPGNVVRGMLA